MQKHCSYCTTIWGKWGNITCREMKVSFTFMFKCRRVERVEPCCLNMADDEQTIVHVRLYKFNRFYDLTYTNTICSVKLYKLTKCIL